MMNHHLKFVNTVELNWRTGYTTVPEMHVKKLSPFSTRRICSRKAKRKQEFSNVIG